MKSRAEQADMILAQVLADPVKLELAIARIEGPSDTYSKLTNLVAKVDELEQEITTAEYDYFTIVAELLLEVQEQMVPFEPYIATPQIGMVHTYTYLPTNKRISFIIHAYIHTCIHTYIHTYSVHRSRAKF